MKGNLPIAVINIQLDHSYLGPVLGVTLQQHVYQGPMTLPIQITLHPLSKNIDAKPLFLLIVLTFSVTVLTCGSGPILGWLLIITLE